MINFWYKNSNSIFVHTYYTFFNEAFKKDTLYFIYLFKSKFLFKEEKKYYAYDLNMVQKYRLSNLLYQLSFIFIGVCNLKLQISKANCIVYSVLFFNPS